MCSLALILGIHIGLFVLLFQGKQGFRFASVDSVLRLFGPALRLWSIELTLVLILPFWAELRFSAILLKLLTFSLLFTSNFTFHDLNCLFFFCIRFCSLVSAGWACVALTSLTTLSYYNLEYQVFLTFISPSLFTIIYRLILGGTI